MAGTVDFAPMQENFAVVSPAAAQAALRKRVDTLAMLVYVAIVYGWSLWVYPLGRDYSFLANPGQGMPFLVKQVFAWEVALFEDSVFPYHLVNVALLYGCMLLVYRFVNAVLRGPAWLGTLAAVLFMANPVHSEAVLNLCGVVDLIPCLLALAALSAYVYAADGTKRTRRSASLQRERLHSALSPALFALAVLPFAQNAALILALALFEAIGVERNRRSFARLAPHAVIALAGCVLHRAALTAPGLALSDRFSPLYFLFYSIGFLPETARNFHERPWLAWLAALATIGIAVFICRKAGRRTIIFGLLSTAALRLGAIGGPIDPVQLVGGGQLLLPHALYTLALVGLFQRIMENANWRKIVVSGTTLLCLACFALQIRSCLAWRHAGQQARDFQRRAAELAAAFPGEPIGVVPAYTYFSGAPLCLTDAVTFDTPFSKALPALSLLPMHYDKSPGLRVMVTAWSEHGGVVRVEGKPPLMVMPWPYELTRVGTVTETDQVRLELLESGPDFFEVSVKPTSGALPLRLLPAAAPGGASLPGEKPH